MIEALLILLLFQLAGEAISQVAALPVPGPVLGMVLFVVALKVWPALAKKMSEVAHGILRNLSLLFVPAGVGVVQHADLIARQALPVIAALVVSTVITLVVTAWTFEVVRRAMGGAPVSEDADT